MGLSGEQERSLDRGLNARSVMHGSVQVERQFSKLARGAQRAAKRPHGRWVQGERSLPLMVVSEEQERSSDWWLGGQTSNWRD